MEPIIEQKLGIFRQLVDNPRLFVFFGIVMLLFLALLIVLAIVVRNPKVITKLTFWKKEDDSSKINTDKVVKEIPLEAFPARCLEHEKDLKEIKKLLYENAEDRETRREEMDAWCASIEDKIGSIITTQTDQGHYIRTVSIGTLENMLDSAMSEIEAKKKGEKVNLKKVRNGLKAFLKLIGLKRNSYNLEKGYSLIVEFKDDFEVIYEDFAKENWKDIEIIDLGYFEEIMDEISSFYGRKLKFHITKEAVT